MYNRNEKGRMKCLEILKSLFRNDYGKEEVVLGGKQLRHTY